MHKCIRVPRSTFGNVVRLIASLAYSTQMILYMGLVLYAPALVLEAGTGLDKTLTIFFLAIGIVCTFYSSIGGMKAVMVAGLFQSILTFAAIYSVIIGAAVNAGGLGPIWEAAEKGGCQLRNPKIHHYRTVDCLPYTS